MPMPKSVTKITSNGIEYTSNIDRASYSLRELSRGALRDVAKFVRKEFRTSYYSHFNKNTGDGGKVVKARVFSSENTKYPRVEMGLKKGQVDGFYGLFQEVGTSKTEKLGLLTKAVEGNVDKIIEIESQYLSALESEAELLRKIADEDDIDIDDEE